MRKVQAGAFIPFPVAPIVLVGADVAGKANYTTAAFVSGVNVSPAIVCVSLNRNHHTPKGIIENKTFSINFPSTDYVVQTDYCGLVSGRDTDKSTLFTTFYGQLETAPMIEEFPISCECRFTGQRVEFAMDVIYFGEIIQVHINEELIHEERKIDVQKAKPLCYSGIDNTYRSLGEVIGSGWSTGKPSGG